MAIFLETTTQRYIGQSTDTKPTDRGDGSPIAVGSSLLETDTGLLYRWTGQGGWQASASAVRAAATTAALSTDPVTSVLEAILLELQSLRAGMVLAETCEDVNDDALNDLGATA